MNVRELINELIDYDTDTEIYLASDPEGNDISPLLEFGYQTLEEGEPHQPVIVLWP